MPVLNVEKEIFLVGKSDIAKGIGDHSKDTPTPIRIVLNHSSLGQSCHTYELSSQQSVNQNSRNGRQSFT